MEIAPVSVDQVKRGRDGRQYLVEGSAGAVVKRLQEIDPSLRASFNEQGNFFVVSQIIPDGPRKGTEDLVMRVPADQWDMRVVRDFEMRNWELRHGLNPADRLERLEADHRKQREYEFDQEVRAGAAPLFHAIEREVVGSKPTIFVPERRTKKAA